MIVDYVSSDILESSTIINVEGLAIKPRARQIHLPPERCFAKLTIAQSTHKSGFLTELLPQSHAIYAIINPFKESQSQFAVICQAARNALKHFV